MFIPRVCILQIHTFALFMDAHYEVWFVFLFSCSGVLVLVVLVVLFVCLFCVFFPFLVIFCLCLISFGFFCLFFEALTQQVSGIGYMIGPCLLMILKACTESLLNSSKIKIGLGT